MILAGGHRPQDREQNATAKHSATQLLNCSADGLEPDDDEKFVAVVALCNM